MRVYDESAVKVGASVGASCAFALGDGDLRSLGGKPRLRRVS